MLICGAARPGRASSRAAAASQQPLGDVDRLGPAGAAVGTGRAAVVITAMKCRSTRLYVVMLGLHPRPDQQLDRDAGAGRVRPTFASERTRARSTCRLQPAPSRRGSSRRGRGSRTETRRCDSACQRTGRFSSRAANARRCPPIDLPVIMPNPPPTSPTTMRCCRSQPGIASHSRGGGLPSASVLDAQVRRPCSHRTRRPAARLHSLGARRWFTDRARSRARRVRTRRPVAFAFRHAHLGGDVVGRIGAQHRRAGEVGLHRVGHAGSRRSSTCTASAASRAALARGRRRPAITGSPTKRTELVCERAAWRGGRRFAIGTLENRGPARRLTPAATQLRPVSTASTPGIARPRRYRPNRFRACAYGGALERDVGLPSTPTLVDEQALAGQQRRVFDPLKTRAAAEAAGGIGNRHASPVVIGKEFAS